MKKAVFVIVFLILVGALSFVGIYYYPYVFAKKIYGHIMRVERVSQPEAILGNSVKSEYVFSFAVSVKDGKGEIHTGSSEDRQWAVAQEGQCVEAKFFPYPPWNLEKGGTYFGARLLRLFDCDADGVPLPVKPQPSPEAQAAPPEQTPDQSIGPGTQPASPSPAATPGSKSAV